MITRRLAIFRIAASSAVAAAAPAVLAAGKPKAAEHPTLIRLGRRMENLDKICQHRKAAKATARAAYDRLRPDLPEALLVTPYSRNLADSEQETDLHGKLVWPSDPDRGPRSHHTANYLRLALDEWAELEEGELDEEERTGRDYLRQRLPLAERYEAELHAVDERSGYTTASGAHDLACYAMEKLVRRIAAIPALTPEGITIKAQAYDAWMRSGDEMAQDFAAFIMGPGIIGDICRVLSEAGEA
ncbi:hypothetical protein [Bradyrhizobium canariense]|uniref:Uncharacterized protein n=1 Tax=Bradyrhizobium canariense TaxID=255045 RepID=A0A1X3H9G5_9BRAD|nr:hypothetical protein [Bradyrhizobium canariense]OSI68891.1 hypothetical protein BSZ22_19900 [Bradyrhizobium canariense]OSI79397.1 hypothetical protein BSZ23_15040 [Bradyrhizobium canariense]OSI89605.1 hypothetical protein BSZ25_20360 [Bradyrhizobium canariense]OSI91017.1 hypothetical protein BSZ24_18845 [Bradyrhizobium canariense]OSJ03971.1 hypothetical protein BSZ16_14795 [Bradyrhizobium canariense]